MPGISIRPSDFVEGGAVPVDKNLVWKECRFALFQYEKKDGSVVTRPDGSPVVTTTARITLVDDDGNESVQHYSVGDPERFAPSDDGKTLEAKGSAAQLNLSCNFYLLLNALVNAGYPEDKLEDDISTLDGLYAYHIGVPEPQRSGLARQAAADGVARVKTLSVPSRILQLPGEKKGAKAAAKAKTSAANDGDAAADALAIVTAMLEETDSVTQQQVATKAIKGKNPAAAKAVYADEFQVALIANGMSLDGEDITKA